ncbi:MAG: ABC transporter permease [Chloroflexi bacterium]|nr:ABC transporter permease [Chloroflexota bacterium]
MNRVWTMTRKEFIHIVRDPRTLSLVIFMPVLLLVLLGYAFTSDIEDIPLAVADQSQTAASRSFVEKYELSGYFETTNYVGSESEIFLLIDEGTVKAGVLIPEDFGRKVSTGESSPVQFYIDGSDPALAQTAQLAAETIGQANSQEILIQQLSRSGFPIEISLPIDTRLRFLYNPDMRRMNFMVPGLIAVILQVQTLLLTAFAIVREREQGTLEQLIVTPIKDWELMLGKILPFVAVALLNVLMALGISYLLFRVPIAGSITLLLGLSLIFLLGSLGFGILISTVARTQIQAMYLATFLMIPAFILSGFLVPRDNMPWLAFYIGYLMPVMYFLEIVRGIILKGVGFWILWPWIWPMALFSIAVFIASVLLFHKRLD